MEKQIKKLVELAKEWAEFCKSKNITFSNKDDLYISNEDHYSCIGFDWSLPEGITITIHYRFNKHSINTYTESLTPKNLTRIITTYSSKLEELRKEEVVA